jgi:hypothetical protein
LQTCEHKEEIIIVWGGREMRRMGEKSFGCWHTAGDKMGKKQRMGSWRRKESIGVGGCPERAEVVP